MSALATRRVSRPAESLADEAYRRIEERIVTLELAPGSVVTEQALCVSLGMGRTPVREALVRLEKDSLVSVLPRQGILVEPVETETTLMALEIRHMVERFIVARATDLASELERRRFRRLADEIEDAAGRPDLVAFMRADDGFNQLVAAAARHPVAARTIAPLHAVTRRLGCLFAGGKGRGLDATGEGHARLMRAIADGDAACADAALSHLLELARTITLAIEDEGLLAPIPNDGLRPQDQGR